MFLANLPFLREGSGNERLGVPRNTGEITQWDLHSIFLKLRNHEDGMVIRPCDYPRGEMRCPGIPPKGWGRFNVLIALG